MKLYVAVAAIWLSVLVVGVALAKAAGRKRPTPELSDAQVRAEFDRILARTWGPVR